MLEEIDELDPRQKFGGSVMVKAKDSGSGYLSVDNQVENDDNMKTMRTVELMSTPYGRESKLSLKSTYRPGSSCHLNSNKKSSSHGIKTPGKDYDVPKVQATVTIPERRDIREMGPLSREYHQRFKKHHTLLTIPKKPVRMEWFEEDELAKGLYEIMMAETDLEIMKRQLSMESDFNLNDCYRMFDLSETKEISRR